MTTSEQWAKLMEEHEIAYLRGDLATSSQPQPADGRIVACGTPEQVKANPESVTARYL